MYQIGIGTGVTVLNSQAVPISQVVLKTGSTVAILQYGAKNNNFILYMKQKLHSLP